MQRSKPGGCVGNQGTAPEWGRQHRLNRREIPYHGQIVWQPLIPSYRLYQRASPCWTYPGLNRTSDNVGNETFLPPPFGGSSVWSPRNPELAALHSGLLVCQRPHSRAQRPAMCSLCHERTCPTGCLNEGIVQDRRTARQRHISSCYRENSTGNNIQTPGGGFLFSKRESPLRLPQRQTN